MCGNCLVRASRKVGRTRKTDGAVDWSHTSSSCWPCYDPIFTSPSWFSPPPGLTLPVGSSKKHPGPKRALPSRGRDVLTQVILPTSSQHDDVAVSDFEKHLRDNHGTEELVSHRSVTSWPSLAVEWFCSNVFKAFQFKPHRGSCGRAGG